MSDPSHKLNYLLPEKVRDVRHRGTIDMTVINFIILDVEMNVLKIAL